MKAKRNAGILPAWAGGTPALRSNPLQKWGWHSRGYLPHWDPGNRPVHVVLRLHDSLPQHLLPHWEEELRSTPDATDQRRRRIEAALDHGAKVAVLRKLLPAMASHQGVARFYRKSSSIAMCGGADDVAFYESRRKAGKTI